MPFGLFLMMTEAPARGTWETKLGKIQDRLADQGTVANGANATGDLTFNHIQPLVPICCSHHAKPGWAVLDGGPTVPSVAKRVWPAQL